MQSFSAISVFVDEVNMTSAQGGGKNFGGNMFDLERVEVLKVRRAHCLGKVLLVALSVLSRTNRNLEQPIGR